MDILDCAILNYLFNVGKATSKVKAKTRRDIVSKVKLKDNTLYKRLVKLKGKEYVEKGFMESRRHTYYITEGGINALKEAMQ